MQKTHTFIEKESSRRFLTCPVGASICKTHDTKDKHNKVLTDCVCMHEHKDKYNVHVSNNNLSNCLYLQQKPI